MVCKWVCAPFKWVGRLSLRKDIANKPCFQLTKYRKHSNVIIVFSNVILTANSWRKSNPITFLPTAWQENGKMPKNVQPSVRSTKWTSKIRLNIWNQLAGIYQKSVRKQNSEDAFKKGSFHRPCHADSSRRALFRLGDCWLGRVTRCRPVSRGEARPFGMGMPWSNGVTVSQ